MDEIPHLLFVPVHQGVCSRTLRLFRTETGRRTAVAFSSPARLMKVLGTGQPWIRLAEPPLRRLIDDLDIDGIVFDPTGTAPARRTEGEHPAAHLKVA
jgi:hypothetical protein